MEKELGILKGLEIQLLQGSILLREEAMAEAIEAIRARIAELLSQERALAET